MGQISSGSAPLILAIETATRVGSVILARGPETLCQLRSDGDTSHSTDLIANVEAALSGAPAKLSDIDLFAAASGPGSFTGLRIGLDTIKSFAVSVGRPCVGVPTLAAIAHAAGASDCTAALLPAGRGEVFAQLFSVVGDNVRQLDEAMYLSPKAVLARYGDLKSLTWAGAGAHVNLEVLRAGAEGKGISFAGPDSANSNGRVKGWTLARRCDELASSIAALAVVEYEGGRAVGADELRAIYVRPSDAEIKERWQQEKS
jgi:tRNA threonylcarbamoyladenosine biosynthesis protein TsaB